jgi:hypothetical protein
MDAARIEHVSVPRGGPLCRKIESGDEFLPSLRHLRGGVHHLVRTSRISCGALCVVS